MNADRDSLPGGMRKKLIEAALPLAAVNDASAREKSIRHGHPSTLHLWWARRPLAAARAVIFAQMVDDPSVYTDALLAHPPTKLAAEREWKKRLAAFLANRAEAGDEVAGAGRPTHPPPTLEDVAADLERQRLFGLIKELVEWKNTTNEALLQAARDEIKASWRRTCEENRDHPRAGELFDPDRLPAFHDPFAGGGALPLEAQRLGLEAHASDLNPVAVLINKAMIEIPSKFAGRPPVNPEAHSDAPAAEGSLIEREWKGAQGLAEDVRYYGRWMRDEAEKRIGHLYPKVEVTAEMARERPDLERYEGRKLTVIAWLWARTVKSPNPAFRDVDVPLASTFMLSTKKGKEAYVEPVIEDGGYRFTVKAGPPGTDAPKHGVPGNAGVPPAQGTSAGKRRAFRCLMSGVPVTYEHIRSEGKAGRMGARLMAIVAEGDRGRVYLAPSREQEEIAEQEKPTWKPDCEMPKKHRNFQGPVYGLDNIGDLFTPRQLVALTTFSDLVQEAIARVKQDALGTACPSGTRASRPHKAWHSRGYLPHLDQPELIQFVTFRLSDSVPAEVVAAWKTELALTGREPANDPRCAELRERIERYSDQGHGACWLRDERIAESIEKTLLHFDGARYRLLAWVIMPNHVHALLETLPGFPLGGVVHSWKSFSAKQANKLLGRTGPFWMQDYFDRYIRDEEHFAATREYIKQNPVKAGLVRSAGDWQWSSASGKDAGGTPAFPGDDLPLRDGGTGAVAYAEAVGLYLGFAQSKACNRNTNLCLWEHRMDRLVATFGRQALPMVWDFAETNPIAGAGGDIFGTVKSVCEVIEKQFSRKQYASAFQADAVTQTISNDRIISTDPPYYDNIGYADLSDFFYVWLRRTLRPIFPDLFATLAVPKSEELVATPYRHGGKDEAEAFFLNGMSKAMRRLAEQTHPAFPVTIYYAFKQSESARRTTASRRDTPLPGISTGWETFLDAVIDAGFSIGGTWPIRTEQPKGLRAFEQNALASSIVLVCRKRPADAALATRRQFVTALKAELPAALARLQSGNIAPVDLAQAAIGPGMAVYTRYARVLDASGKPVSVREALALINQTLDETLAEQEGDFDADSRWALAWFEQHGFDAGEYGAAETLSKAKNTSVGGLVQAGVLASKAGKVRLLKPGELPADWDPATDPRLTAWETVHQLIRTLETGGETAAARLVRRLGGVAETARELAYRLYAVAERRSRAAEALSYNALVQSWPEVARLAHRPEPAEPSKLL